MIGGVPGDEAQGIKTNSPTHIENGPIFSEDVVIKRNKEGRRDLSKK